MSEARGLPQHSVNGRHFKRSTRPSLAPHSFQAPDLLFQSFDRPVALGGRGGDIGRVEALRDVLGTILVPCSNCEENHLLGPGPVTRRHELGDQVGVALDNPRRAPDFDPPPAHIVDEEQIKPL